MHLTHTVSGAISFDITLVDTLRTVQAMIFNVLFFTGEAVSGVLLHVSNAYDKISSWHDVVLFYFT